MDKRSFKMGTLTGVLTMCIIGAVIFGGLKLTGHFYAKATGTQKASENADVIEKDTKRKLGLLSALVGHYYLYEDEVDEEMLEEGMYKGYIAALGDPYSCYYDEEATNDLLENLSGEFEGIGAILQQSKGDGYVEVVSVYSTSPAKKAGLKNGDLITKVDDRETAGKDLSEVVSWIRGEKGTDVTLTVERKGADGVYSEKKITVTRSVIEVESVEHRMLDGKVGYIRISEFEDTTYEQFKGALTELDEGGAKGLVIDLRDNPGGNLDTVCDMLDLILPKGTVVYTKDKYDKREDYKSDEAHKYEKPLCVLVNGHSASASEIFAGAVQDFEAGKIVGTTTYGKGVVQQIIDLKDGTSVKLTVAEYFTPDGRNINKKGIKPDVKVESGDDDIGGKVSKDKQLRRAIGELDL
ncbi:MAG: S41 family peptidase [Lachnospiraceae bacterium]|nr:S41 family peptidase [Lachnospiraceae bacterium]